MATLALGALASSFAGTTLGGTAIVGSFTVGKAVGMAAAFAGNIIDRQLFAPKPDASATKMTGDALTGSAMGHVAARLYETAAIQTQVLYATLPRGEKVTQKTGGKGGLTSQTTKSWEYFMTVGLLLGREVSSLDTHITLDGKRKKLADFDTTLHDGVANVIDDAIEAIEGVGNVTPYPGLAYLVIEDLPLTPHGNRMPQARIIATRSLSEAKLAPLLAQIFADDGLSLDVTAVPDRAILGAVFTDVASPRDRFPQVAGPHLVDLVERAGGAFAALPRWGAPVASYHWQALPAGEGGGAPLVITRAGPDRLPARVEVEAADPTRNYEMVASASTAAEAGAVSTFRSAEVLNEGQRLALAHAARADAIARRVQVAGVLPARAILDPIDVGSIISLTDTDGSSYAVQITSLSHQGSMYFQGETVLRSDPFALPGAANGADPTQDPADPVLPTGIVMELPSIAGLTEGLGGYVAAYSDPWFPCAVLREQLSSSGADHDLVQTLDLPATIATLDGALTAGTAETWAASATLALTGCTGILSSRSQAQVEANAINALAIKAADGTWEVLQFATATLTGPGAYTLTGLYRGRGGYSVALADGAQVVLLDGAVQPLPLRSVDLGVARTYRIGPAVEDISGGHYDTVIQTPDGAGRAPLAVTSLAMELNGEGSVTLTWARPAQLAEPQYWQVTVLVSTVPVRSLRVTSWLSWDYLEAQQIADLGSALVATDTVDIEIYEVSAEGIPGPVTAATVTVTDSV